MEKIFYLANLFGGLSKICTIFLGISLVAVIVLIIGHIVQVYDYGNEDELAKVLKKWAIISSVILFVSFVGHLLVPDKNTYLLMKGSEIVENAYNNSSNLQELPGNTAEFLNEYVKTLTKELKEGKNK